MHEIITTLQSKPCGKYNDLRKVEQFVSSPCGAWISTRNEQMILPFNSFAEAIEFSQKGRKHKDEFFDRALSGDDWTLDGLTWHDTLSAIKKGYNKAFPMEEVTKKVDAALQTEYIKELIKEATVKRKSYHYSEEGGDTFNIERIIDDRPDVYLIRSRKKQKPLIKIGFNAGVTCNLDVDDLASIMTNVLITAEVLTLMGYNTLIDVVYHDINQHNNMKNTLTIIPLKDANKPLDVGFISTFSVMGLFRAHIFTLWYAAAAKGHPADSGLGRHNGRLTLLKDSDYKFYYDQDRSEPELPETYLKKYFKTGSGI